MPRRIQRRRTKGWRLPAGVACVSRPSKWGNPFSTGNRAADVAAFRDWALPHADAIRADLRGRDLACWCRLDQPCHADVLLEMANS